MNTPANPEPWAETSTDPAPSTLVRTTSSRTVYRNQWMVLREDRIQRSDGTTGLYSVVDKTDFAVIIPAENDGFHLVEQFRYPIGQRSLEFPQGTWTHGHTGTTIDLARTELAEETGLTADHLEHLATIHNAPGLTSQTAHIFLATGLHPGTPHPEPEEHDLRTTWTSRTTFENHIRRGTITDATTIAAYQILNLSEH
jgi:8-oxo-dGDP phosphatase